MTCWSLFTTTIPKKLGHCKTNKNRMQDLGISSTTVRNIIKCHVQLQKNNSTEYRLQRIYESLHCFHLRFTQRPNVSETRIVYLSKFVTFATPLHKRTDVQTILPWF